MYPTLGDAAIQNALTECDATIMFTTKDLLFKLANAVQKAPKLKTVIYFPPLHKDPKESNQAEAIVKDHFTGMQRDIHTFDAILEMGAAKGGSTTSGMGIT